MYRIRLVGYASKVGNQTYNETLSYNRINEVAKFAESVDRKAGDRIETFRAVGELAYSAAESDDSPEWRAVEMHVFIGDIPPGPMPNVRPIPRPKPPLPGGERWTKWEVASPGGAFMVVGLGVGFNVFFIRNVKTTELRGYIQPVLGYGAGLSVEGLKLGWSVIQNVLTGWSYSAPDFESVTASAAVTWEEMEACLVRVSGAGAGLFKGASAAVITFIPAYVWQYGPSGFPLKLTLPGDGVLFQFLAVGENWQLGANASVALGPLVRVGS